MFNRDKVCSLTGCAQVVYARRICKLHYDRHKRTGNYEGRIISATSKRKRSPEVRAWYHMKSRCNNPNDASYKNYGGRGIYVCERWNGPDDFFNFLTDMGERPSPQHSLDRIDVNGPYSPDNCRWATKVQQQRNTRSNKILEYNGKCQTAVEWAEELTIPINTFYQRLYLNWDTQRIVGTPVKVYNSKKI